MRRTNLGFDRPEWGRAAFFSLTSAFECEQNGCKLSAIANFPAVPSTVRAGQNLPSVQNPHCSRFVGVFGIPAIMTLTRNDGILFGLAEKAGAAQLPLINNQVNSKCDQPGSVIYL